MDKIKAAAEVVSAVAVAILAVERVVQMVERRTAASKQAA